MFAYHLFQNGDIIKPVYDDILIKKSNVIDVININAQDIIKSINYIEQEKEKSLLINKCLTYKTFTQKEFEDFLNEITDSIINIIRDIISY